LGAQSIIGVALQFQDSKTDFQNFVRTLFMERGSYKCISEEDKFNDKISKVLLQVLGTEMNFGGFGDSEDLKVYSGNEGEMLQ